MDYRLNSLYKQMLKGKVVVQTSKNQPKNLTEAYKNMLVERTAFYAKSLAPGEKENIDPNLISLGVIENEKESKTVQNRIRSFSILDTTAKLLASAGWSQNNSVLNANELGQIAFDNNISSNDLSKILINKKNLTYFEKIVTSSNSSLKKFNFVEELYTGVKDYALSSKRENFIEFLNTLTSIQGTVNGTNVGPGEFAASLFTNSVKPLDAKEGETESDDAKGDLRFGDIKVEMKQSSIGDKNKLSGAKLGYAHHAVRYIQSAMQEAIKESGAVPRSKLAQIRGAFDDMIKEHIKTYNILGNQVFTEKVLAELKMFDKFILNLDLNLYIQRAQEIFNVEFPIKAVSNKYYSQTIESYIKKGYIISDSTQVNTRDLQNQKEIVKKIIQILKFGFYKIRELSSEPGITQKNWQSYSPTVAINEFFLSDLGLTSQQLANVLYEIRPYDSASEDLKQKIQNALNEQYANRLKRGDEKALRGLVFAIHLSEYARQERFQYLLLINRTSKHALSIPTPLSCFDSLLKLYENSGETEFIFRIDLGGRQGAHTIAIR